MKTLTATWEDLGGSVNIELPKINTAYIASEYCFIYGLGDPLRTDASVTKVDICKNITMSWSIPNHYPGEPLFVAGFSVVEARNILDPNGTSEDDGVLLSIVFDGVKGVSYMAVIDAQTLELLATAYSQTKIPYSFHGQWIEN